MCRDLIAQHWKTSIQIKINNSKKYELCEEFGSEHGTWNCQDRNKERQNYVVNNQEARN